MGRPTILAAFSLLMSYQSTFAQYSFFNPDGSFAIEVSLPNSALPRLPIYRNAISSLMIKGDIVVGGTASSIDQSPFLFTASLASQEVLQIYDLQEVVSNQKSMISGFATGDNLSYIGTIGLDSAGHLLQLNIHQDGTLIIKDLGIPVPGEGILALTLSKNNRSLYGLTYPSGIFFSYDIPKNIMLTFDNLVPDEKTKRILHDYALDPIDYLGKSLIEDNAGKIWGSAPINALFSYEPSSQTFETFPDQLPEVWGRRTLGAVDSWAKSEQGLIYGGNGGDGQLFLLSTENGQTKNLGKPIMMNRLRALTFAADGRLYGLAGGPPGYTHLFSFDNDLGFQDLGNPEFIMRAPGIEQGIRWRGYNLTSMFASEDGKYIVMGEDESLSQLMVFPVH
ncbi:MAG: hypothetical protein HKN87_20190 [Saprospiraceae bacterium]|nr:hypothetical protein [Saprospiraceae bacterium]